MYQLLVCFVIVVIILLALYKIYIPQFYAIRFEGYLFDSLIKRAKFVSFLNDVISVQLSFKVHCVNIIRIIYIACQNSSPLV